MHISIDRLVLPASYAGREGAFTEALDGALRSRLDLPHGSSAAADARCVQGAERTAGAILDRVWRRGDD
ncbi:hypothetical protein AB2B41_11320 [Marimonas sp. MJW-29]|uniref:Uncharacterized protein n=1 Tax=Sulfitobacter sediminis TaxID=3234186 RepID=A0ABV3RPB8_9RHOB